LFADSNLPNYFVDNYEGNTAYYGYPMDFCIKTGLENFEYVIFTCGANNTAVTRSVYNDEGCTEFNSSEVYTSADIQENGIWDFNCGGITSYVEIKVCVRTSNSGCDSNCIIEGTTYSVVDVCHYGGNGTSSVVIETVCDPSGATASTYSGTSCDTTPLAELEASAGCSYFTDVPSPFGDLPVYAQMIECVINNVSQTGTTMYPMSTEMGSTENSNSDDAMFATPGVFVLSMIVVVKALLA
jgi:hypothetical protein